MRPIVLTKAEAFGTRIIRVHKYLVTQCKEKTHSSQLNRSGTAIAALIAEAEFAQSRADFVNKMQIALKEANESKTWINMLYNTGYFTPAMYKSLLDDLNPIIYMLIAIIRSTKGNGL